MHKTNVLFYSFFLRGGGGTGPLRNPLLLGLYFPIKNEEFFMPFHNGNFWEQRKTHLFCSLCLLFLSWRRLVFRGSRDSDGFGYSKSWVWLGLGLPCTISWVWVGFRSDSVIPKMSGFSTWFQVFGYLIPSLLQEHKTWMFNCILKRILTQLQKKIRR